MGIARRRIPRGFVTSGICLGSWSLVGSASAVGAAPAYRIGPDDILVISVWDQKELDQTVFVRPDGKISLPLLGEVQAGGLTVGELSAALTEGYGKTIKNAQV